MSLTQKQVLDLDRMNVAAQRAKLGQIINTINDRNFVIYSQLNSSDISGNIATVTLVDDNYVAVNGATILSYSVIATDGTVRAVTKVVVTGTDALLTITSVVATDTVSIVYTCLK